jgi:hypothetical protein
MRILMIAAIVAVLAVPAKAQNPTLNMPRDSNLPRMQPPDPRVQQYRKEVDQEYRQAIQKIPEQKKKTDNNDPWANVRSIEPAGKPKRAN